MEKNYYIQINETTRTIMLDACNVFEAVRILNFFQGGMSVLKRNMNVKSIELYKIGEPLPKRILI